MHEQTDGKTGRQADRQTDVVYTKGVHFNLVKKV